MKRNKSIRNAFQVATTTGRNALLAATLTGLTLHSAFAQVQSARTAKVKATVSVQDPILVDLSSDSSGIRIAELDLSPNASNAHFDHEATNFPYATSWAAASTGLLVYAPEGVTSITSGKQLFGNNIDLGDGYSAPSGYDALQHLAGPKVTVLTKDSPVWSKLKVWVNSTTETKGVRSIGAGELKSLDEVGIVSLNLKGTLQPLANKSTNSHAVWTSEATLKDGSHRAVADYLLTVNRADTVKAGSKVLPVAIDVLPDMIGSGVVHDLSTAMLTNDDLVRKVKKFNKLDNLKDANELVDQILASWVLGPDSVKSKLGEKRAIIERFAGITNKPIRHGIVGHDKYAEQNNQEIAESYKALRHFTFATLAAQAQFSAFWPGAPFKVTPLLATPAPDFARAGDYFDKALENNVGAGTRQLSLFVYALAGLDLTKTDDYLAFKKHFSDKSKKLARVIISNESTTK